MGTEPIERLCEIQETGFLLALRNDVQRRIPVSVGSGMRGNATTREAKAVCATTEIALIRFVLPTQDLKTESLFWNQTMRRYFGAIAM